MGRMVSHSTLRQKGLADKNGGFDNINMQTNFPTAVCHPLMSCMAYELERHTYPAIYGIKAFCFGIKNTILMSKKFLRDDCLQ